MSHQVTILKPKIAVGKVLEYQADGSISKAPQDTQAKHFDVQRKAVDSLDDLLRVLSRAGNACFIHGQPKPGTPTSNVLRRKDNFIDQNHPFIAIDIDAFEASSPDPVKAATEIRAQLPTEFQHARCIWNATSGHALKGNDARIRLFFWTDRKVSTAECIAWLKDAAVKCDASIWRTVQEVYIAPPIVKGGKDPVAERWGILDGQQAVYVPTSLEGKAKATQERARIAPEGVTLDDAPMIDRFLKTLATRDSDRIDSAGGRRLSAYNAANDAADYGLTEEITTAIVQAWVRPEEDLLTDLTMALSSAIDDPAQVDSFVQETKRIGDLVQDAMTAGEALDDQDIAEMVEDAYLCRTGPIGSRYEKIYPPDDGADFEAAEDEGTHPAGDRKQRVKEIMRERNWTLGLALDWLKRNEPEDDADEPQAEGPKKDPAKLYTNVEAFAGEFRPIAYIVRNMIPRHGVGFIVAPSHVGKSFACIDLMGHVARGENWLGHKITEPLCCLYVCGEGQEGVRLRFAAWLRENGTMHGRVATLDAPPNLYAEPKPAAKKVIDAAKQLSKECGLPVGLVIFDTVASLTMGMEENSAKDVGVLTGVMRKIATGLGCAVCGVHHTNKTDKTAARGSGSFYNNVEFELIMKKDEEHDLTGAIMATKNRDGARSNEWMGFKLQPVKLGEYDDGAPVTSLVFKETIVAHDDPSISVVQEREPLNEGQQLAVDCAVRAIANEARIAQERKAPQEPTTREEVREAIRRHLERHAKKSVTSEAIRGWIKQAIKKGYLAEDSMERITVVEVEAPESGDFEAVD